jgi:hypothetical protein
MPIAEIINEIDEYLSRLRQARELLSRRITEVPQETLPRPKRKVFARQTDKALSVGRHADGNETQSNRAIAQRKEMRERGIPAAPVLAGAPLQSSHKEQPAIVVPQCAMPQNIVITRLPSRRRKSSNMPKRHRMAMTESGTKPDAIKPAIALAGAINTKVVVISAEQVKREREQAARPEIRQPRVPASGLSGRRAFEALFKDE